MAPELFYFNIRGRADLIRLILIDNGVEFKETRINRPDWPSRKSEFVFGQMPVLRLDSGEEIAQSHAIARYGARLSGQASLLGATPLEAAMVDMWYHQADDVYMSIIMPFYTAYDTVPTLFKEKWAAVWMAPFEKRLADNEFLANNRLSIADYHLFGIAEVMANYDASLLQSTPKVAAFHQRMLARPGVAKFRESVKGLKFTNSGHF